jgi:hypothetical protein
MISLLLRPPGSGAEHTLRINRAPRYKSRGTAQVRLKSGLLGVFPPAIGSDPGLTLKRCNTIAKILFRYFENALDGCQVFL